MKKIANYHFSVKSGGKSKAGSHSDYIHREGKYKKYEDLQFKESGNIPEWATTPQEFWKAADDFERANARTYCEFELSLPNELSLPEQVLLVQEFVETELEGYPYSYAIHAKEAALKKGTMQPHAHIMFSERKNDGIKRESPEHFFKRADTKNPSRGGCLKNRRFTDRATGKIEIKKVREKWADMQNAALERAGFSERVDHRSLQAQRYAAINKGDFEKAEELNREPQKYLGVKAANFTKKQLEEKLAAAKTPEEKNEIRNNYYNSDEALDVAKEVYLFREYARIEQQLSELTKAEKIKELKSLPKELRMTAIKQLETEVKKLRGETKDLAQKSISAARAKLMAYNNYLKSIGQEPPENVNSKTIQEACRDPKVAAKIEQIQTAILRKNEPHREALANHLTTIHNLEKQITILRELDEKTIIQNHGINKQIKGPITNTTQDLKQTAAKIKKAQSKPRGNGIGVQIKSDEDLER